MEHMKHNIEVIFEIGTLSRIKAFNSISIHIEWRESGRIQIWNNVLYTIEFRFFIQKPMSSCVYGDVYEYVSARIMRNVYAWHYLWIELSRFRAAHMESFHFESRVF